MVDTDDEHKPQLRFTTAREMLAGGYRVEVWCPKCQVWRTIDLQRMLDRGRGDESLIGRRWRCRRCGGAGQMQLQAPAPGVFGPPPKPRQA